MEGLMKLIERGDPCASCRLGDLEMVLQMARAFFVLVVERLGVGGKCQ